MKKFFLFSALVSLSLPMLAGGQATNTNMSVAYLRGISREGYMETDGVYYNPAGTAFMKPGWHFTLSLQNAHQTREVTTTYAPLAYGAQNGGSGTKTFKGTADAPVIPAVYGTYNWKRWNVQLGFNVVGGGGKCTYNNGLAMFEVPVSNLPLLAKQYGLNVKSYDLTQKVVGEQYTYGLFLGTSYEPIEDHLSVSLGVRGIYMKNHYYGGLSDIKVDLGAGLTDAKPYFGDQVSDIVLDCEQRGFGLTPVIGIDYRINDHWNLMAKYEFKTHVMLKNESMNNEAATQNTALSNYQDGVRVHYDLPTIVTVGALYSPIKQVRLAASYHFYDDKHACRSNDAYKKDKGTHEVMTGIEYDPCKLITLSAGWQGTYSGMSDEQMTDMSFSLSSNNVGAGMRFNIGEHWKIDLGYYHTFYAKRDVTKQNASTKLEQKNHFERTNRVFGLGVSVDF